MSKFLNGLIVATLAAGPAVADGFGLGRPALPEEIAAWDIDIRPDGQGLPEGSGTVAEGEVLYIDNCASCHGDFGEAIGRWPVLAGGDGSLTEDRPVKTVGSYWPYLSTVYDYVHRAMPFGNAQSLSDDEVYAITAYLLNLNFLVDDDFELSRENFSEVRLPNEENFFLDDRANVELAALSAEPCMTECKESVEITARAAVIDVTPEDAGVVGQDAEASAEAEEAVEVATTEEVVPAVAGASAEADPVLVAEGEALFKQCRACHDVGEGARNKTGPHLNNVFGRAAGGLEGFRYSGAMQDAGAEGLVWNAETLAGFLADPRGYMKGTRMSFRGLRAEEDIAAMNAYLSTLTE